MVLLFFLTTVLDGVVG